MTYYQLNNMQNNLPISDFLYVGTNELSDADICISKTLRTYLNNTKTEIDAYCMMWDRMKKITNPYEYIHTQVPGYKMSISKHKPLSRSFFKFIEIATTFNLTADFEKDISFSSFHLAEGPGGFIEALVSLRNKDTDRYYGMTLLNNDINVPGWHKSQHFLSKNSNVMIEKGINQNGDLLDPDNLDSIHEKYKNSMSIVTGDGGFDFSIDFNQQEATSAKLLFAQICYAILLQKQGGHFVLKVFDTFSKSSVEMMYILSMFYENIFVIKPYTSRYANSERYVVCKKFRFESSSHFLPIFKTILREMTSFTFVKSLLTCKMPYLFVSRMEEINSIFGQQQLETIVYTLSLIQNNNHQEIEHKIEQIIASNIQKCCSWCMKHGIFYNKLITNTRVYSNVKKEMTDTYHSFL